MEKVLVVIAMIFTTTTSFADEPTFAYVQSEFQRKAALLLSQNDISENDFNTRIVKLAAETFGAHRGVMRKEMERRFMILPQFHARNLTRFAEHKSLDLRSLPPMENSQIWLAYGCDPEALAEWVKKSFLARELKAQGIARRALLNTSCPDKVYWLGKGEIPNLIVESLGDLFVIEVEVRDSDVCRPLSVKWMKKK